MVFWLQMILRIKDSGNWFNLDLIEIILFLYRLLQNSRNIQNVILDLFQSDKLRLLQEHLLRT